MGMNNQENNFGFADNDDLDNDNEDLDNELDNDDNSEQQTQDEDIDIDNDEDLQNLRKQSPKLDSAFAKLRKQAEQQEKKAKELDSYFSQKYKAEFNINNADEFLAYMKRQDEQQELEAYEKKKEEFVQKGIDPADIEEMINNHPLFKQTKDKLDRMEQNTTIKLQLDELTAKDKRIQSIEDINKILPPEKQVQFWDFYKKNGLSLSQAYSLVLQDELLEGKHKAGKQSALNSMNSKSHMKTHFGNADFEDEDEMTAEELRAWKGIMGWSDSQIKDYKKKQKQKNA